MPIEATEWYFTIPEQLIFLVNHGRAVALKGRLWPEMLLQARQAARRLKIGLEVVSIWKSSDGTLVGLWIRDEAEIKRIYQKMMNLCFVVEGYYAVDEELVLSRLTYRQPEGFRQQQVLIAR